MCNTSNDVTVAHGRLTLARIYCNWKVYIYIHIYICVCAYIYSKISDRQLRTIQLLCYGHICIYRWTFSLIDKYAAHMKLTYFRCHYNFWHPLTSEQVENMLFMMTSSNGNIFRVTGHLCEALTGPRWIPRTRASDAERWCFLWSAYAYNVWSLECSEINKLQKHWVEYQIKPTCYL